MPEAVVFPENAQQIAKIMKANRALVPVVARGGGTGLAAAAVPLFRRIVVSTERMNQVLEINEDAMYMVVQPGVRTDDVQKAAKEKACFTPETLQWRQLCHRRQCRDQRRRQPCNQIWHYPPSGLCDRSCYAARQNRSIGRPTGKIDDRLFAGPFGDGSGRDLGIITEITLKLKPMPNNVIDLLAIFPTIDQAIGIVTKVIKAGITPTCVEFMDNGTVKSVGAFPEN